MKCFWQNKIQIQIRKILTYNVKKSIRCEKMQKLFNTNT